MTADVLVLLGTDRHPFERLARWADRWAQDHPGHVVQVQHGYTTPPRLAAGTDFFSPKELQDRVAQSRVVVAHAGPGTMMDARSGRHRPVVLPRDPDFGEHVDGHQLRFAAWAQDKGLITTAQDLPGLDILVERELQEPATVTPTESAGSATQRVRELLRPPARTGPVLFIAGLGRSGSTLVERVLGQSSGVGTLGEVLHLWERGVLRDELCGCGLPFSECPQWVGIGERAFGGWDRVDLEEVRRLGDRVDRQRRVLKTASPVVVKPFGATVRAYADYYRRIYEAAAEVTGAGLLIDSGKHPSCALALSHDHSIDLRVLHLVRDSLGVAHSWSKSVRRPEAQNSDDELMARYSPMRSSAQWLSTNVESELLRLRRVPVHRMRYEDFVTAPGRQLGELWSVLGLPGDAPQVPDEHGPEIVLRPNHSAAGNPMRFASGATRLRPDTSWRTAMAQRDRRQVALLTGPLRALYGYRGIR